MEKSSMPSAEELLKKIQELEEGHIHLKQEMSKLIISGDRKKLLRQVSPYRPRRRTGLRRAENGGAGVGGALTVTVTENRASNILQSMGQSVHMFDLTGRIIYWSRTAECIYGFMASEALGKNPNEIIVEPKHLPRGYDVIRRMTKGERWCGEFPVRNKRGETFDVLANGTSLVDENGTLIGGVIVSTDTRPYQRTRPTPSVNAPRRIDSAKLALDAQQPLQTTIASRISNLASKVKAKLKTGDKLMDDEDNEDVHSSSKMDLQIHSFHDKILWEDLTMGQQIGQGSCGTVYHAMWYGSDVAVKVFSKQEFSIDVILPFRQEVSLMKRLRHPNILLFMGAVTSPQRLSIVTEFLPRGSLFRLIQRNTTRFDWRRRVHIAIDIARGMNYLHLCQPPIIHRDLKSSNLLVDKNWTVKVGDFGLSRIKNETYLTTKTGKGTPQWMAPEILRNEQANENYGVVLWEITTEKIPWESLNSMQVIGAVGFMNQQLDIPKDVDLQWASLLESCLCSEPKSRPTFYEILDELKILQKKFAAQLQASRTIAKGDNRQKAS